MNRDEFEAVLWHLMPGAHPNLIGAILDAADTYRDTPRRRRRSPTHYIRHGTPACGRKRVGGTKLTRDAAAVTCAACQPLIGAVGTYAAGDSDHVTELRRLVLGTMAAPIPGGVRR